MSSQTRPYAYLTGKDIGGCDILVSKCDFLATIGGEPIEATSTTKLIGQDCEVYTIPSGAILVPVDTWSVDLTASGQDNHTIKADVRVKPNGGIAIDLSGLYIDACSIFPSNSSAPTSATFLACNGGGITTRYTVEQFETPLVKQDTNTVAITLAGVAGHNISSNVVFSAQSGNQASALPDGVFVPKGAGLEPISTPTVNLSISNGVLTASSPIIMATTDETLTLNVSGVGSHNLYGAVILSGNTGQQISRAGNGLYVPKAAGLEPLSTPTVTLSLIDGVLSATSPVVTFTPTDASFTASVSGVGSHNITGRVVLSPDSGQQISLASNGLFVPKGAGFSATPTATTNPTVLNGDIKVDVIPSPNSGMVNTPTGVGFDACAITAASSSNTSATLVGCDGFGGTKRYSPNQITTNVFEFTAPILTSTVNGVTQSVTLLSVTSTNNALAVSGTMGHTLTVVRDTVTGSGNNTLQITSNGLYVPPDIPITAGNAAISATGTLNHTVGLVLSTTGGNTAVIDSSGLYVPAYTASSGIAKDASNNFTLNILKCGGTFNPASDKVMTCCEPIGNTMFQVGTLPTGNPQYSQKNATAGTLTGLAGAIVLNNTSTCRAMYFNIEPHLVSAIDAFMVVPLSELVSIGAVLLEFSTNAGFSWDVHAANVANVTNRNIVDNPSNPPLNIVGYGDRLMELDQWDINKVVTVPAGGSQSVMWRIRTTVNTLHANFDIWTPMFTVTGIQA